MNSNYNKRYFKKRDYLDLHLAQTLKILMNENKLSKALDVGCGTGRLVEFLNENKFDAFGCDSETEAVRVAKKYNSARRIYKASATSLPFKNNFFDIVTAVSLIEHLSPKEAEQFIEETRRVLKKKGFFFLVTPNFATPIRLIQTEKWFGYSDPTHINFYTPKSLKKLLSKKKFSKIRFRFKTDYYSPFNFDLPSFVNYLPFFKALITYLLISTPLTLIKNSFWIAGQKNG